MFINSNNHYINVIYFEYELLYRNNEIVNRIYIYKLIRSSNINYIGIIK